MANEAQVTVEGFLGADPEFRFTPNGHAVTTLNLANTPSKLVNEQWVDGNTIWFRVFVWGKDAAGVADAYKKGNRVLVRGTLIQGDAWTDKQGNERKNLEITASFIGSRPPRIAEPAIPVANKTDEDPLPVEEFPW